MTHPEPLNLDGAPPFDVTRAEAHALAVLDRLADHADTHGADRAASLYRLARAIAENAAVADLDHDPDLDAVGHCLDAWRDTLDDLADLYAADRLAVDTLAGPGTR